MAKVQIFWDPNGFQLNSIGTTTRTVLRPTEIRHLFEPQLLAAWQGYEQYQSRRFARESKMGMADTNQLGETSSAWREPKQSTSYKCDGRIYCSHMTSCAEATFFLQNCPGVKMDGDNDGIPCEKQWCN